MAVVITQAVPEFEDIGGIHPHPSTAGNQWLVGTQPLTRQIVPTLEPDQTGFMGRTARVTKPNRCERGAMAIKGLCISSA